MSPTINKVRHRRYFIPEWETQKALFLTWPHPHSDWKDRLAQIEQVYLSIAKAVTQHQTLFIICYDEPHRQHVATQLNIAGCDAHAVQYFTIPSNDTWIRDYGPLCMREHGKLVFVNWQFDGWGKKFSASLDNEVCLRLWQTDHFNSYSRVDSPITLEGGSVETNGQGLLLTTVRCLLTHSRNAAFNKQQWESVFAEYLNIQKVMWLQHGFLEGDDTDGHIDTLARFCSPTRIAYSQCTEASDTQFGELEAMQNELETYAEKFNLSLTPLPLPSPIYDEHGNRLPANYANFIILNQSVLYPTYHDPMDRQAHDRLQQCFPEKTLVGIPSTELLRQGGSLHCASLHVPME